MTSNTSFLVKLYDKIKTEGSATVRTREEKEKLFRELGILNDELAKKRKLEDAPE